VKSIRIKLLISVLGVFVTALSILTLLTYHETSHEIEEVFDAELVQTARMINQLALANIDSKGEDIAIPESDQHQGHKYEKHISYQVWFHNTLVLRSESAPLDRAMATTAGYSDNSINDKLWRVFALYPESSPYRIYTAEDHSARDELTWEIVIESLGVYFWSLPILGIIFYFILSNGLTSLKRISEDVSLRDVNRLKPLNKDEVPSEILPLVTALNELLAKLDIAILKERRFTSDASHELRTPLSGIKLHAQLALQASNSEDRDHALQQIISAVDNSTHLVEQMLTLTRLDPANPDLPVDTIELQTLCDTLIDEMQKAVQANHQRIIRDFQPADIQIDSNRDLLYTLLRNLLENAIQHAGDSAEIIVGVHSDNDTITVTVEDNGPGIPETQQELVTQRFYRLADQEVAGCGLGLSIATEAATRLGAELQLSNRADNKRGLLATVKLPVRT
jgi:two-component system sensor histidine kinase QseC